MGLEIVQIVMEIEESLGVRLPDERIGDVRTAGDLYQVVLEAHPPQDAVAKACLSAATFRLLRRAMQTELKSESLRLHPRDEVDSVLPHALRRRVWSRLQSSLDLQLPSLERPKWLLGVIAIAAITSGLVAMCLLFGQRMDGLSIPVGAVVAALLAFIAVEATSEFATHLPASCRTVGELTQMVLAQNYARLSTRFGQREPQDVWDVVRTILARYSCVPLEVIARESRLVEDLGLG